jgi:hypothetical protein
MMKSPRTGVFLLPALWRAEREGRRTSQGKRKGLGRGAGALLCLSSDGLSRWGEHTTKTPCRLSSSGGGQPRTRRLEPTPHGALTSRGAYPLQHSSPKGCCVMNRPAIYRESSHLHLSISKHVTTSFTSVGNEADLTRWRPTRRAATVVPVQGVVLDAWDVWHGGSPCTPEVLVGSESLAEMRTVSGTAGRRECL